MHKLVANQFIPRPVDEVFAFFADPNNLARLTPPAMQFESRSNDRVMRSGLEIDYRLRPVPMIQVSWRSRIEAYDPPRSFVDVQLRGPYRRWEHRHTFRAVDGGTQITDEVEYELPFGPLGDLVHRLVVRNQLRHIFDYRAAVLATALQAPEVAPTGRLIAVAGGTGFVGGAFEEIIPAEAFRVRKRECQLSGMNAACHACCAPCRHAGFV